MTEISGIETGILNSYLVSTAVDSQAVGGSKGLLPDSNHHTLSIRSSKKDSVQLSKTVKKETVEVKGGSTSEEELSEQEKQKVSQLKETDRKVRAHEQAHVRAGGDLIRGMAQYTYDIGPDKKRYAVAGEVSIDTSPVKDDPAATIQKAERIKKTALAPADPSSQDRAVAAEADRMAMQARLELARAQQAQAPQSSGKLVNLQV